MPWEGPARRHGAISALIRALKDSFGDVRRGGGGVGADRPVCPRKQSWSWRGLLKDDFDEVCIQAAQALGKMGPLARPAIPALIQALHDRSEPVGRHIARADDRHRRARWIGRRLTRLSVSSQVPDKSVRPTEKLRIEWAGHSRPAAMFARHVLGLGDASSPRALVNGTARLTWIAHRGSLVFSAILAAPSTTPPVPGGQGSDRPSLHENFRHPHRRRWHR